jgi:hypothetical protein
MTGDLEIYHDLYMHAVTSYQKLWEDYYVGIYLFDRVVMLDGKEGIVTGIIGKGVYGYRALSIKKDNGDTVIVDRRGVKLFKPIYCL